MLYELILYDGATRIPLPESFKTKFWKKSNAIRVAKITFKFYIGNIAVVNKLTRRIVYVCED